MTPYEDADETVLIELARHGVRAGYGDAVTVVLPADFARLRIG